MILISLWNLRNLFVNFAVMYFIHIQVFILLCSNNLYNTTNVKCWFSVNFLKIIHIYQIFTHLKKNYKKPFRYYANRKETERAWHWSYTFALIGLFSGAFCFTFFLRCINISVLFLQQLSVYFAYRDYFFLKKFIRDL